MYTKPLCIEKALEGSSPTKALFILFLYYNNITDVRYHSMYLGITFQVFLTNQQGLVMQLVKVVHTVAHLHSNLLPGLKTQIAFLKNGLQFCVRHTLDGGGDLTL